MYLKQLQLAGFRNYDRVAWDPHGGVNLIMGKNAAGKTNLLEAVYLCTTGYSFRTARFSEIINWQNNEAKVECTFALSQRDYTVRLFLTREGRKVCSVNGKKVATGKQLPYPAAVVFTPGDLDIVGGNPARRRRFLDFDLGPLDAAYHYQLRKYNRALQERNSLLRVIKSGAINEGLLVTWNEQLISAGAELLFKRLRLLHKLVPLIKQIHQRLAGDGEKLEVKYLSSLKMNRDAGREELKKLFGREIYRLRDEEIKRGTSMVGPHRDELVFHLNGVEARHFGSRGQQRTIVLALKMALLNLWERETGEHPIFLLDDVLQELDVTRQEAMLDAVRGKVQTFITTSSERMVQWKDDMVDAVIHVDRGNLQREV